MTKYIEIGSVVMAIDNALYVIVAQPTSTEGYYRAITYSTGRPVAIALNAIRHVMA